MIRIEGVTVRYGWTVPLDNVTLDVGSASTAIVGPSGSGKSTLLRVIAGLQCPDAGSVALNEVPVAQRRWSFRGDDRVAVVHQDHRLVAFLTVGENVMLGAESRGKRVSTDEVKSALTQVGLVDVSLNRDPKTLSGGEQQRVAIARAVVSAPELLVADEPTGELDQDATDLVAEILLRVARVANVQVVVATHDPRVAARMGHVLRIGGGRVNVER